MRPFVQHVFTANVGALPWNPLKCIFGRSWTRKRREIFSVTMSVWNCLLFPISWQIIQYDVFTKIEFFLSPLAFPFRRYNMSLKDTCRVYFLFSLFEQPVSGKYRLNFHFTQGIRNGPDWFQCVTILC